MVLPFDLKRVLLGVLVGGALGLVYQRLVGCRTGTCPLTATPLRGMTYGALVGLLFSFAGTSGGDQTPAPKAAAAGPESAAAGGGAILHLTASAFAGLKAQDKPVILDFWAPWCGPCRTQGPILEQVSSRIGDRAIVAKVNVDEEPGLAAPFGIESIPTLVVMKGGKVVQRFTGVQQADTLVKALQAAGA